jgi:hypothetical protein
MTPRPAKTIFGGRLRASTVVLLVVFAGLLALFVLVRP